MAEPKPLPACANCDHICENPLNEDGECWGRMTAQERLAFGQAMIVEAADTTIKKEEAK